MQTKSTTTDSKLMAAPTDDVSGFYGTIRTNEKLGKKAAQAAWECAMRTITDVAGYQPATSSATGSAATSPTRPAFITALSKAASSRRAARIGS
jgi:hypothetical protein